MESAAHYEHLRQAFDSLLRELSKTWPEPDLAYVREEVGHAEYGDALENLVSLSVRNGRGFSPEQAERVGALATLMEMRGHVLPAQRRLATG